MPQQHGSESSLLHVRYRPLKVVASPLLWLGYIAGRHQRDIRVFPLRFVEALGFVSVFDHG